MLQLSEKGRTKREGYRADLLKTALQLESAYTEERLNGLSILGLI